MAKAKKTKKRVKKNIQTGVHGGRLEGTQQGLPRVESEELEAGDPRSDVATEVARAPLVRHRAFS